MIKLSQKDPRWGGKTIGKSQSLIKDYGCTITSIAMASDYFGCYHDPGWMAKYLNFLVDKVLWQSIEKVLCFKFEWRFYRFEEGRIDEALKNPKKVCLLNVYNGAHWVIATSKIPLYGYYAVDPWTGTKRMFSKKIISGGAVLVK